MALKSLIFSIFYISLVQHVALCGETMIQENGKIGVSELTESSYRIKSPPRDGPVLSLTSSSKSSPGIADMIPVEKKEIADKTNLFIDRIDHENQVDHFHPVHKGSYDRSMSMDTLSERLRHVKAGYSQNLKWKKTHSKDQVESFKRSIKTLKKINVEIEILNKMSFSKSGELVINQTNRNLLKSLSSNNWLSPERIAILFQSNMDNKKAQSIIQEVSDSIVLKLEPVLKNDPLLPPFNDLVRDAKTRPNLALQQAGLRVTDFLVKNKLVKPESIRSLFQDKMIVENVLTYSCHRFYLDIEHSFLRDGSPYITEHWYWPTLHGTFELLSEREEKIINTSLLLKRLKYRYGKTTDYYRQFPEWITFMKSFNIERLRLKFAEMERSQSTSKGRPDDFGEDVTRIIDLLLMPGQQMNYRKEDVVRKELDFVLADTLSLIERYLSPGTLKIVSSKHNRAKEFNERFNLIVLSSKIMELKQMASNHFKYEELILKLRGVTSDHFRAICVNYVNELQEKVLEFEKMFDVLKINSHGATRDWLHDHRIFGSISQHSQTWVHEFKHLAALE